MESIKGVTGMDERIACFRDKGPYKKRRLVCSIEGKRSCPHCCIQYILTSLTVSAQHHVLLSFISYDVRMVIGVTPTLQHSPDIQVSVQDK